MGAKFLSEETAGNRASLCGRIDFVNMRIYFLAFICATVLVGQPTLRVDVEVTDKNQMLSGFQKEDFEVFDQNSKQQIVSFSQDSEPLDLVLVFDITSGLTKNVGKVLQGAHSALGELRQGDRVAVMSFSNKNRVVSAFTDDMTAVERTLENDVLGKHSAFTKILPAIDEAASLLAQEPANRRRAVLVVTNNQGALSGSPDLVTRSLWEKNVLLNGLIVPASISSRLLRAAPALVPGGSLVSVAMYGGTMSHTAERTGGDVRRAGADAGAALQESIKRIRMRYSLVYTRPQAKPGQQRSVEVKLSADARKRNPHAKVLARTGYWIPKS